MDLRLKGRKAVVTGGSKGIGFAIAEYLLKEEADVVLVARSEDNVVAACDKLRQTFVKGEIQGVALDLSESSSAEILSSQWPDIDILVNNAGAIPGGDLDSTNDKTWREGWDLKVFGYINLTRQYYRRMCERRRGVIINIIGNRAERPDNKAISGSTGNAALAAFTKALGASSPANGVRAIGVSPGWVATDRIVSSMRKRALAERGNADCWEELLQDLPFGRAATPEEIAAVVAFLASDISAYTTGTIITVDGGLSNRGSV